MSFREYLEGSTTWYVDGKNIGQTVNGHGYLMECIKKFYYEEFGDDYAIDDKFDFEDLEHVSLVYTQTLDGLHDIKWEVNIPKKTLTMFLDGEVAISTPFDYYFDLGVYIQNLASGDLITTADIYYKRHKEE